MSEQNEFKCTEPGCSKSYKTRLSLYNHKRTHNKPHTCDTCEKRFLQKDQLAAHKRRHTSELKHGPCLTMNDQNEFKCIEPGCSKSYKTKLSLYNHKRTHNKPHKCDTCEKRFLQKDQLAAHRCRHTSESRRGPCLTISQPNKLKGTEPGCSKSYAKRLSPYNHKQTHNKLDKVDTCEKRFSQTSQLAANRCHHPSELKYGPCSTCKKMFGYLQEIVNYTEYYKRSVSEGKAEPLEHLICFRCKMFKAWPDFDSSDFITDFYEDMFDYLKEAKPYRCPERGCSKKFSKEISLYNHKRTHNKPFKCDLCDQRFLQKSQIPAHRRHHTGECIYGPCCFCKEMFFNAHDIINYTAYYKSQVKRGKRAPLENLVCFPCAARRVYGDFS